MDSPTSPDYLKVTKKSHHRSRKPRKISSDEEGSKSSISTPPPTSAGDDDVFFPPPRENQNPRNETPESRHLQHFHQHPDNQQWNNVQESDGNFFESFTALSWRQENKRLRATSEDGNDKIPPSELQFAIKPKFQPLSRKEFELLYIEVLYTIKHKIGTTAGGHLPIIQDLYQYAQESFGVSPEDHARLLAKATEEKPPILILNLTVIEAKGLEAKDADGYSDPYCMVGIIPGRLADQDLSNIVFSDDEEPKPKEKEKKSGLRKFSTSLKKKKDPTVRDLLPAKYIRTTIVQPNTLNPVWNEKFRFDLEEANTDQLHLDIWDHDDEFSVIDAAKKLNEVQSMKGLGRFFKQIAQSARTRSSGSVDDFLGCLTIPLNDLPSTGKDTWYKLEGRSAKSSIQGEIRLKLSLATREDRGIAEDDNWTDVRQHEDLVSLFVQHEIRKFQDVPHKWSGNFPKAAKTILHQHAIQGDVTDVQQAMCRWMAYSKKHMEYSFSYELLLKLLTDLDDKWNPDSFSREEEECLAESFTTFIDYCVSLIRRQREVFPFSNKAAFTRLENMLRCLAKIYSTKVFRSICPFEKELHSEVGTAIKKGTLEWYDRNCHVTKSKNRSNDHEEDTIQRLIELTNTLNGDLHAGYIYFNKLYEGIVSVKYFIILYRQLEKLLTEDVYRGMEQELGEEFNQSLKKTMHQIEERSKEAKDTKHSPIMGTTLFELYLALQEFCSFKEKLPEGEQKKIQIMKYYQWFRFIMHQWIEIARHKAFQRIYKAVELDKITEVNSGVKYSTSAVDVCCCFQQMTEFWKQLNWPDLLDSFTIVHKLTEDISQGGVTYADLIHQKLKDEGYYDDEGQFDVTEQLCITINDIEQVRRALKPLPETLRYTEIQRAVESSNERGYIFNLNNTIKEADGKMVQKIKEVVDRVADKMRPDIKKYVFHLNWAPESVPADDAVGELLKYLDSNLLTLNNNLLKTNFDRILLSIWVEVLEEFKEVLVTEEVRQSIFYQRMFDALQLLVEFFNAGDKGLSMQKIKIDQYKDLKHSLSLHKQDTFALIDSFYQEKLQQQKEVKSLDYGVLNVRMCYRHDTQSLFVEILDAKNIIPLDANGLSDPFVLVKFCPEHIFPTVSEQKTKIIKKTLNPTFEESFEFNVSVHQCRHKAAVLVFTVMDHDYVFQNDFAGEAYVHMADVPGVDGDEITGFEALNVKSLPLMQPKHKENGAFDILASRTWDKDAQEFVRIRTKIEEQAV